ncbi:carcinoembryonic antigen-related cell adhesion molecule 21-like [Sturnira hondurensis]|uniref:carcinoembryonic antigen-related cell adhesion molecule 21-like n=1 Tax=Sturnira hondurensis TaxID=192404 RepID=UPI0018798666|nr:carcinoembryonic antigen-related cell adhesion molecule 21-like [Sturnira hondurensis]
MGPPSVSTHRGHVHWQGLLVVVSLLNFWSLPTTAQFAIVSTNAPEGKDIHLRLRNTPPDALGFFWYRGEGEKSNHRIVSISTSIRAFAKGPLYTGREIIYRDGSLQLKKVTKKDTGIYTVVAHLQNSKKEIGFGRLNVYEPVRKPTLQASSTTVTENKDAVVLTCYSNAVSIEWLFYGMNLQLSERRKLSKDRRSLTIDPVKREDAGYYQCEASNPISSAESWPLELHVQHE